MFSGSMVAIITPFQNGQVDYRTLEELVDFPLESGTDGIVPVGTTGESPTLTHSENKKVIDNGPLTVHYKYNEVDDIYTLYCMDYKQLLIPLYEKFKLEFTFSEKDTCMIGSTKILPRDAHGIYFIEYDYIIGYSYYI